MNTPNRIWKRRYSAPHRLPLEPGDDFAFIIAPNRRRFRFPSARNNPVVRACFTSRPPVFSMHCSGIVSDQFSIAGQAPCFAIRSAQYVRHLVHSNAKATVDRKRLSGNPGRGQWRGRQQQWRYLRSSKAPERMHADQRPCLSGSRSNALTIAVRVNPGHTQFTRI